MILMSMVFVTLLCASSHNHNPSNSQDYLKLLTVLIYKVSLYVTDSYLLTVGNRLPAVQYTAYRQFAQL